MTSPKDRPYTLSEILINEYLELGILDQTAANKVEDLRITLDAELGIKPFEDTARMAPEDRSRQFHLRGERHALLLKKIRELLNQVSTEENIPTALCLSGGGIRSATFCLGVLQSLARHKLIGKFHYLSTVSGGGYIGSWFSAWNKRGNLAQIEDQLDCKGLEPGTVEPKEVTYLRTYSNYMSPSVGLLSTDTWTLIATYLRNLILNWTVFVPIILAVLLLPKI